MITYLGSLTLGDAVPGAQAVTIAAIAGINAALPDVLARLASLQAFAPSPVSFDAQLALANGIVTSIQTSIALGLSPPSIATQLAAVAALIAELLAAVSNVEAQFAIATDFQNLLGAAGVHALAYTGTAGNFAPELAAELASGPGFSVGTACSALVLVTTVPATWAAMASLFKVSP